MKKRVTNWKYILIVAIFAFFVAVFSIWQLKILPKELFVPEIKKQKKIEVTEELTDKIIEKIVPENFDRKTACFFVNDLDNDKISEIIIGTTPPQPTYQAYLTVVTPIDETGNYKKIADFYFDEENISFRSTPCLQEAKDILDIDGDGKKEFVLDLGTGGASNEAFGIFKIDWEKNKIEWLKIKRKDGQIENSFFLRGGSVMHQEDFELKDLDSDGKLEIIEKEGEYIGGDWESKESWKWQIFVYKWDGEIYNYDEELSNLLEK